MASLQATALAPGRPTTNATRSGAIDALRVIAVAGIVTGHVWAGPLIDGGLYTWHVPVFFLLSGYLWKRRAPDGGRAVVGEAAKRFRTIMIPYIAWLLITLAAHATILDHRGTLTSRDIILPLLGGPSNGGAFGAYWFMPALFLSAIMFRALEQLPVALRVTIIAGITAATYVFGADLAPLPMSVGVAGGALIFMLAGQALQLIRSSIKSPARAGVACLAAGFTPVLAGWSTRLDMKFNDLGTPVLSAVAAVLISAGLLLILEGFFVHLPQWAHVASTRLAAGCLMVVLTHTYVLWLLAIPVADRPLWVLIVALFGPWFVAMTLNRTRVSQIFLGTRRTT